MRTFPAVPLFMCFCVTGEAAFYGDPPDATHPWAVHDMNRPQPPRVEPGAPGAPPSDAVVLFDGTGASLGQWESAKVPGQAAPWRMVDGAMEVVPGTGDIRTRATFGDCQLHVEWCAPQGVNATSQGKSNSGIFLTGDTEVQVLDNYENPTYADGFAGSVYGVNPPHANALRPTGQWQTYDIIFRRPVYRGGKLSDPGRLTVLANGVVVQDSTPLEGGGGHKARSQDRPMPDAAPLRLQDHGNPVRFRNIWYRPLPRRAAEGGDMGAMNPADATAKKHGIAAGIRADAGNLQGRAQLLRRMESLCYENDTATAAAVDAGLGEWLAGIRTTPAGGMEAKKNEIMEMFHAVRYLVKFNLYQDPGKVLSALEQIVSANGWDPR